MPEGGFAFAQASGGSFWYGPPRAVSALDAQGRATVLTAQGGQYRLCWSALAPLQLLVLRGGEGG